MKKPTITDITEIADDEISLIKSANLLRPIVVFSWFSAQSTNKFHPGKLPRFYGWIGTCAVLYRRVPSGPQARHTLLLLSNAGSDIIYNVNWIG